jgi:hypothetical protein
MLLSANKEKFGTSKSLLLISISQASANEKFSLKKWIVESIRGQ